MNIGNLYFDINFYHIFTILLISSLYIFFINKFLTPNFVIPKNKINYLFKFLKIFLISITIFLLILAILKPKRIIGKKINYEKTLNIQILFDVSLSMAADDIKPSRFEVAKNSIADFIKKLPGYNISVIMFSGWPIKRIPFTDETLAAASKMKDTKLYHFPPIIDFVGTAIGNALFLGIDNLLNFAKNKQKPGIIVLLTDGDSNKGYNPLDVARYAKKKNIPIYLLAIGKNDYDVAVRKDGTIEKTYINIDNLKAIVDVNGGKFYRILSENDFKQVLDDIKSLIKNEEKIIIKYEYINIYKFLYLLLAIFLLINIIYKAYIFININKK